MTPGLSPNRCTRSVGQALDVKGLSVRTSRGRVLLSVPALSVASGALLGVRGPSGAGKSTLLFALGGLLEVRGRVLWDSLDLAAQPAERRAAFRAANLGMIFQDFLLFEELSPQRNAALTALFAPPSERKARSDRAAKRLAHLGIAPEDRSVASYSGGERQRVAVARALAGDPPILLADEPTASLDRTAADRLIDDLTTLAREAGKTFIAVSHDTHLLDRMDRVLTIEDGQLVDDAVRA